MRKILPFYLIVISLAACLDENRVAPAKPSTFVRYINGGYSDEPRALEKTPDGGYIILANTLDFPNYNVGGPDPGDSVNTITPANEKFPMDRVKLIKVDPYGTVLWTRILPDKRGVGVVDFRANGILVYDQGYIITGEVIKSNGKSNLLIIQTNSDGRQRDPDDKVDIPHYEINLASAGGNVHGVATARISATQLLVLGSVTESSNTMILSELNLAKPKDSIVVWQTPYSGKPVAIINKLFTNGSNVIFCGSIDETSSPANHDVNLSFVQQNLGGAMGNLPFGQAGVNELANDLCRAVGGYAVVGSSKSLNPDQPTKQDRDIMFNRFTVSKDDANPILQINATYPVYYPGTTTDVGLDDEGNSICSTLDGGFIILGTIQSTTTEDGRIGRGESDYYLLRIDPFGQMLWAKAFGSKRADTGIAVRQAEDGGYVVLGQTQLANVPTITLIKTNPEGNIE